MTIPMTLGITWILLLINIAVWVVVGNVANLVCVMVMGGMLFEIRGRLNEYRATWGKLADG